MAIDTERSVPDNEQEIQDIITVTLSENDTYRDVKWAQVFKDLKLDGNPEIATVLMQAFVDGYEFVVQKLQDAGVPFTPPTISFGEDKKDPFKEGLDTDGNSTIVVSIPMLGEISQTNVHLPARVSRGDISHGRFTDMTPLQYFALNAVEETHHSYLRKIGALPDKALTGTHRGYLYQEHELQATDWKIAYAKANQMPEEIIDALAEDRRVAATTQSPKG